MSTQERLLGTMLSWRNIVTPLFLLLPALGLWMVIDGLTPGSHYSAMRVVVIENAEIETQMSRGGRFGYESTSTFLAVNYHYTDQQGHIRQGIAHVDPNEITLENRKPGSQALIRVAVEKGEGSSSLDKDVGRGLAMILIFGLMSLPGIAEVRWKNNPEARKTWYQLGSFFLAVIAFLCWMA